MPRLVAVCAVSQLHPDGGRDRVTAIDKRALDGRVRVGRYGVGADVQADRKHHGGIDQAIYAYGQDDAEFWQGELGRELPAGWFGENLRIEGFDVNAARVGEVWRIGEPVLVEVTLARTPCGTFARWVGGNDERGWVRRFFEAGRLGAYLKVLKTGTIAPGDAVTIVSVPEGTPAVVETAFL